MANPPTWESCLAIVANVAAIATAAVAVWFFCQLHWARSKKLGALERHLKNEKAKGDAGDQGQRSIKHLMRSSA
jgi:hypothetical protein